jgi:hypothetical protein
VRLSPPAQAVHAGEEGAPGWTRDRSDTRVWQEPWRGWGFCRFELGNAPGTELVIERVAPSSAAAMPAAVAWPRGPVEVELPDPHFVRSLEAQLAHLAMSTVGAESRPGEPWNYPLFWMRDGAYVLAALARAGLDEPVRQLAGPVAERDFPGGFGPEADAPGLALWALGVASEHLGDSRFDRALWPHVQRKAGLIVAMLEAREPIHEPIDGPIVPTVRGRSDLTLVAEPSRDGLIVGRMDFGRPILFVNAVSHAGLLAAAGFAERVGDASLAARWRERANELQAAWIRAFAGPELDEERSFVASLHPSPIAAPIATRFSDAFARFWEARHAPDGAPLEPVLWTYFEAAQAHQWLALGRPERAAGVLRWLFAHQTSPGLYTWWEGEGEENGFGRWEGVRGWVDPPHVTPHYWTAAEVLLLQLATLGRIDEASHERPLVVGAGIAPEWFSHPLAVRGLPLPGGSVDWTWDGREARVLLHGATRAVRLGPAFPTDARLEVVPAP